MKNTLIKYTFGTLILVAGLFGTSLHAQASVSFNTDGADHATLRIVDATVHPSCSTCWVTSTPANAGDTITVDFYYHNTGDQTAQNTNFKLIQNTNGSQTTHSISGQLSASNGGFASGTVTATINGGAQTLTPILGSALWYPNQGTGTAQFPYGQTGDEILGGGVTLGNLAPGWPTQGHITYKFRVGSVAQAQLPIVTTNAATNVSQNSATFNGFVNPNGATTNSFFKFGLSAGSLTQTIIVNGSQSASTPISALVTNLQQNTTYYYQACATNSAGTACGNTVSFTTPNIILTYACNDGIDNDGDGYTDFPSDIGCTSSTDNDETNVIVAQLPIVTTQAATSITTNSALLRGIVNPNGSTTNSFFKLGFSAGSLTQTFFIAGSQSVTTPFSTTATSLQSGTTYYFQACATNSAGTNCGSILSFTTNSVAQTYACNDGVDNDGDGAIDFPSDIGCTSSTDNDETNVIVAQLPIVTTNAATNISQNFATFNGVVNPNGGTTNSFFKFGFSAGSLTQTIIVSGSQSVTTPISEVVTNLQANTTYYYQACATNNAGTNCGNIVSFTTLPTTQNGSSPAITTSGVASVSCTSVTFNGVYGANNANTSTWFEYGTTSSFGNTTPQVSQGMGSGNFTAQTFNLSQNQTYYFRAVAQNQYGINYGQTLTFTTNCQTNNQPIATTNSATNITDTSATLNGYVDPQGSCTTFSFQYGTNFNSLTQSTVSQSTGCGTGGNQVSQFVSGLIPNTTYYFRIIASNAAGAVYGSTLSFMTTGGNTNLQVATTVATSIGRTAARLNGLVSNNNGTADVWFQWGGTQNLGLATAHQYVTGYTQSFSTPIFGLSSNTTYYFRAVAQATNGSIVYGNIVSFTTLASNSVVVINTGGGSGKPYVELSITTPFATIAPCDKLMYTVNYKNVSGGTLRNVVLNVSLSSDIQFSQSTTGIFSDANHALQVTLGTLVRDQSGSFMLEGKADCTAKDNDLLVATATIAFTTPSGAQDDAIAYATSSVVGKNGNFLAGLALFGDGGFFPTTLIGWLLLILVIFLLILLARRAYGRREALA